MGERPELQDLLEGLQDGLHVYFQPPVKLQVQYPAIIYSRDQESVTFADNAPYFRKKRYQVTIIDSDPDSPVPDLVGGLPLTRYVRHFTTASLYHNIYSMYF